MFEEVEGIFRNLVMKRNVCWGVGKLNDHFHPSDQKMFHRLNALEFPTSPDFYK
jgi:hypothetical protein